MADKKEERSIKRIRIAVESIIAASMIFMVIAYILFMGKGTAENVDYGQYRYHIAIISNETDSTFWQDVCKGAVEAGEQYGAYVEQTGDGLQNHLSMEDAINIAIYEKVDGILLRPEGEEKTREMIDKACRQGIPVITMQTDVTDSKRQGFVGLNDYFLGLEYGKRLMKIAEEDTRLVTVLFPGAVFNETSRKWFCLGLNNAVPQEKIRFDFRIIWDDRGLNNAEDVIRDMTEKNAEHPDIMICLDEVITQSAYQLIRDKGMSGKIQIIGSYISNDILEGIKQGTIDSTITIDPEALGRKSVDVLMTYKKYHMVSYYTEVDTMLVDQVNAADYGKGNENAQETDFSGYDHDAHFSGD